MHWLETRVRWLHGLSEAHENALLAGRWNERENTRTTLVAGLREVVNEVATRSGVTACFAAHEGLSVETAGRAPDFEALSAMTQCSMVSSHDVATTLSLGKVQQMVIVGEEHKLALFFIGPLALGVLAPAGVQLGDVLAR